MTEEKFYLKWNEFELNISNTFSRLRNQSSLFDVTLVSNDHKQIQAHKLVLSACSEFFSEIFKRNTHHNPLLYLGNVGGDDLNLVLDYIYQGEVQISQESLYRFMEIASMLKLEGLLKTKGAPKDVHTEELQPDECYEIDEETYLVQEDQNQKNLKVHKPKKPTQVIKPNELAVNCETPEMQQMEIEAKFQEVVVKQGKIFTCTVCNKHNNDKRDMRRHVESHMTGLRYDCQQCGKSFRYPTSLNRHRRETLHEKSI